MPGNRWRSRWSEGRGPGGARTSKARAGHRTGKACHRRWAACGKPQRYAAGRQIPPVRAGYLNWARPDLCGGRPVMAVPTRHYILQLLYLGCQWKELPIDKDGEGRPEIHYTRIYSTWRRWEADGCIDAIFTGSVMQLHHDELLDVTLIPGDGTTTAPQKASHN